MISEERCECGQVCTPRLTGERNEGSVLFSIEALARLAPPAPESKKPEGSSLIDLRALAAMETTARDTPADDVMHLAGGGAFATPMLYVEVEEPRSARTDKRALVAALGVGAAMVIGATLLALALVPRNRVARTEHPSTANIGNAPPTQSAQSAPQVNAQPVLETPSPARSAESAPQTPRRMETTRPAPQPSARPISSASIATTDASCRRASSSRERSSSHP